MASQEQVDSWEAASEKLQALSAQLNALRTLREPRFTSRVPVLGPLVVAIRRLWNWMSTKWYVQPILEQQNQFNERLVESLDELAAMVMGLRQLRNVPPHVPRQDPASIAPKGFGFLQGEDRLATMDAAALLAWENAGVPMLEQHRDELEARADELLDEDITLSYPLHWGTWAESWRYLFDLGLSNEILGCCPGDLVLDLAAGSCWASEFLCRVGFRTVSLDLSLEMLRRGRRRMSADRRLENRAAEFTVGSALHLPFGDETFDGVLCMNALHHMPSYRQSLQEIYRVLKMGGRAVFSEPGAAHATIPLSQLRMREHGVLEKNVSLPLVHLLAKEVGFSRMKVVPLREPVYYLFEYAATSADGQALQQMWEDTLSCSPLERARFVLEKGPERSLDSHMPPHMLLEHRPQARITLCGTRDRVRSGEEFTDQIVVANTGEVTWRAQGLAGQVTCGVKICTEDGEVVREDLGRTCLPHDVAPGEDAQVELCLAADLNPGRYLLKYDLVVEHVAWFEHYGSPTVQRLLEVTS